jgi:large subunit ribosomal protein L31
MPDTGVERRDVEAARERIAGRLIRTPMFSSATLGERIGARAHLKAEIHPEYVLATVRCACGNEFQTRSTKPELHVEVCSNCHPFYTGKQKLMDSGGRVERFQRRLEKAGRNKA